MMNNPVEMRSEKAIPVCYKNTELGLIPEDWDVINLNELASFGGGTTPSRALFDKYYSSGVHPWAKTLDLNNGAIWKTEELVTDSALNETSLKKHKAGSVLIAMYGGFNQIGRTGLLKIDSAINQALVSISPHKNKLAPEYLLYNLNYNVDYWKMVASSSRKDPNITSNDIKHYCLPLPSVAEQIAIANVLSDTDALITELEHLISKKQAIKTATMQQLLTGNTRLPQFAKHPDGTLKGYKICELGKLPEDWTVLTYGEIFDFLSTSTNARADLNHNGEYGYIHYGDIHTKWNNKLDASAVELPKISKKIVSSSFLENGDVIMADASEDYSGIGKSIEVCNIGNKKIVAGLHTYLLRDKYKQLSDGYRGYLHSNVNVKKIIDQLATGMKVFGISKNNLLSVPVPVPPKQEQTAITTILSDMDAELTALERKLAKVRDIKKGMMQQLLPGRIRLPLDHQP